MEPLIFSPFRLSDLKLCRKIDRFEAKPGTIQSQCLTSACDRRQTRRLSLLSRITVEILYYTGTPFVREFLSLSTFLKTSTAQKINEWGLTHHWGASQKGIILFSPGTVVPVRAMLSITILATQKKRMSWPVSIRSKGKNLPQIKKIGNFRSFNTYAIRTTWRATRCKAVHVI
jgi:hypothetical protein